MSLPLDVFEVKTGDIYRFRIVSATIIFPVVLSFEDHEMIVVASDGRPIQPLTVDYLIVYNGERYDVDVVAKANPKKANYFIKLQTLEHYNDDSYNSEAEPNVGLAILRYSNVENYHSFFSTPNLSSCKNSDNEIYNDKRCRIANCPFPIPILNAVCFHVTDFKSALDVKDSPALKKSYTNNFQEHFITTMGHDPGLNGFAFVYPYAPPPLAEHVDDVIEKCPDTCNVGQHEHCQCTQILKLKLNNTIQLVLVNYFDGDVGFAHPMHIHGHHFYVIKKGFATYNDKGIITGNSPDFFCDENTAICQWENLTWADGNIPGANLENPPLKDTVVVPLGGYVVLRVTADNPGFWMAHCHIMVHHGNGMALMLQEGEIEDLAEPPDNVKSYVYGKAKWNMNLAKSEIKEKERKRKGK